MSLCDVFTKVPADDCSLAIRPDARDLLISVLSDGHLILMPLGEVLLHRFSRPKRDVSRAATNLASSPDVFHNVRIAKGCVRAVRLDMTDMEANVSRISDHCRGGTSSSTNLPAAVMTLAVAEGMVLVLATLPPVASPSMLL